ncbi:right-handed parallel beta-helix repeat-containing protein [Candidatus Micrarchaeota archaeon]|nr:right-handed parallel beta-helix repeat-containing protein [Candidatus Micrarchaeota archaeon]
MTVPNRKIGNKWDFGAVRGVRAQNRTHAGGVSARAAQSGMSRGQFLRTAGIAGGAIAAAGLGLGGMAKAQTLGAETTVSPAGTPFDNWFNIQYALYHYGKVYFNPGVYDLGGFQILLVPVFPSEENPNLPPWLEEWGFPAAKELVGIPNAQTGALPKIISSGNADMANGIYPSAVMMYLPSWTGHGAVTFRNLEIEHNGWDALNCFGSNGFTINNCILKANESTFNMLDIEHNGDLTITDSRFIHKGHGNFGTYDTGFADDKPSWGGITFFGISQDYMSVSDVGNITVTGNTIESLKNTAAFGIVLRGGRKQGLLLSTTISNNTVNGPANGIEVDGIDKMPKEILHIDNNHVTCRAEEIVNFLDDGNQSTNDPVFLVAFQNGIQTSNASGLIQAGSTVSNNSVNLSATNPTPDNPFPWDNPEIWFDANGNPVVYSAPFYKGMHFGEYLEPSQVPIPLCVDNLTVSGNTIVGNPGIPMHYPLVFDNNCANNVVANNRISAMLADSDLWGSAPSFIKLSNVPAYGAPHNNTLSGNVIEAGSRGPFGIWCDGNANLVAGNSLKGLTATLIQAVIANQSESETEPLGYGNEFKNNDYGSILPAAHPWWNPCDPGTGFAIFFGAGNRLVNENFWGNYPGWSVSEDGCITSFGCVQILGWGNTLTALKNNTSLSGLTLCDQVWDVFGGNKITGYERCLHRPDTVSAKKKLLIGKMQAKERKARVSKVRYPKMPPLPKKSDFGL